MIILNMNFVMNLVDRVKKEEHHQVITVSNVKMIPMQN